MDGACARDGGPRPIPALRPVYKLRFHGTQNPESRFLGNPIQVLLHPVHILRIHKLRISESKFLGKFPMDLGIPPLIDKDLLESNPPKSRVLVRGLGVRFPRLRSFAGNTTGNPFDCRDLTSRMYSGGTQDQTPEDEIATHLSPPSSKLKLSGGRCEGTIQTHPRGFCFQHLRSGV